MILSSTVTYYMRQVIYLVVSNMLRCLKESSK